jgi:hypothetical protein
MFITSPDRFAEWFNEKIPDACRKITSKDVRLMTECKLMGRYRFYDRQDMETVRAVLQYEQLQQKRIQEQPTQDKSEPPKCKRCGQPLPYQHEAKKGRRREYCSGCEPFRVRERNRKWRRKRQVNRYCYP